MAKQKSFADRGAICRTLLFLAFSFAITSLPALAQKVIAKIPVGMDAGHAAVNSVTNKTYVLNTCGNDPTCASNGTVTVVDGVTFSTQTVAVGYYPYAIAVNAVTNKIYVVNNCGNDPLCNAGSNGTVTVIDGVTLFVQSVTVGIRPDALAIDSVTNKIYVPDNNSANITVIDGATLTTQTVADINRPFAITVNPVTNKIYATNGNGTVTVIDGVTLSTQTIAVGSLPYFVAVNTVTNKVYVANLCGNDPLCNASSNGTVTVIDGVTLSTQTVTVGLQPFVLAVNSVTNKTYVANSCGSDSSCHGNGTVTVIDGVTLSTQTVTVGSGPLDVQVDPVTNKTYTSNVYGSCRTCGNGTVTVIDGDTLSTSQVVVGTAPQHMAVNSLTDRIYVPIVGDNTVSVIAWPGVARYDSSLKVPLCSLVFRSCDSGPSLLLGRDSMSGGAEPNEPNTIHNSCADGTAGTFHADESNDRLSLATTNGLDMTQGSIVRVTATVWVADPAQDALDLYYATDAINPAWTLVGTLVPQTSGSQTLTTLLRLRPGPLQAVRANFRKGGTRSSCSPGQYDDHDDLAFAVR